MHRRRNAGSGDLLPPYLAMYMHKIWDCSSRSPVRACAIPPSAPSPAQPKISDPLETPILDVSATHRIWWPVPLYLATSHQHMHKIWGSARPVQPRPARHTENHCVSCIFFLVVDNASWQPVGTNNMSVISAGRRVTRLSTSYPPILRGYPQGVIGGCKVSPVCPPPDRGHVAKLHKKSQNWRISSRLLWLRYQ